MPIASKKDYLFYLKADLAGRGKTHLTLRDRLQNQIIRYQRMLRKIEYLMNREPSAFDKVLLHILEYRFNRLGALLGFSVPPNTCGSGLVLVHYGSIIISDKASLGKDCRIHSCVNIGEYKGKAPTIGDRVYIGPGAKLYGDIHIGNGVVVGANAVVNKSFPDNVTIAGIPANIIAETGSDSLIPLLGTEIAKDALNIS
jgi:serine O-acetyltransferase